MTTLKSMLERSEIDFLLEAHNGISARIGREAGFHGLWASGLTMSAALGLRDSNEASWTQVLDVAETIADASGLPVLLDGDTGFGNFNNFRRLIAKLQQRGIAGVCIEDKCFPKMNSFIDGEKQKLANMDEVVGKIQAGRSVSNADCVIVARTEALIAGRSMDEALWRAEAYRQAGANAIVIHSKKRTADEVLEFLRRWERRCPVIVIPTTYYSVDVAALAWAGVSVVIWANHLMRAAIGAMQRTAADIFQSGSIAGVEDTIVPVEELFRLTDAEELRQAEQVYG